MTVADSSTAARHEYACYWIKEDLREDPDEAAPLIGEITADVCIVGGGYVGRWTAIHLKERAPDLNVVIVERRLCGTGASGRNEGFLMSWWSKFPTLERFLGREMALELCHHSAAVVDKIGVFFPWGLKLGWLRSD